MDFGTVSAAYEDFILEHRRHLHQYPELSWEEVKTTAYLDQALRKMGLSPRRFENKTGLTAFLKGSKPGPTIALRADIDALPVSEQSGVDFCSRQEGVMHACGHDCHSAMLLGAAKMLVDHQEHIAGNVLFLFQAAEETCHGAQYYIEQGVLDGVDAIFGMHIWSLLQAPAVSVESGDRMASCDNFKITIEGESSHGASPHLGKDAIIAAASILMNLQTFVSRLNDPLNPLVLTVGTIEGGERFNIIAKKAVMEGTIRTFSRELRGKIPALLENIVTSTAQALGTTARLEYWPFPGPVINDQPHLNEIAVQAAQKIFGKERLGHLEKMTGSEDFAYYMEKIPGFFAFLGGGNPKIGAVHPHHSGKFKLDESVLTRGAALYAQFAADFLEHPDSLSSK